MTKPDPDPFVRDMDPRIQIRTKISWIRKTGFTLFFSTFLGETYITVDVHQLKKLNTLSGF